MEFYYENTRICGLSICNGVRSPRFGSLRLGAVRAAMVAGWLLALMAGAGSAAPARAVETGSEAYRLAPGDAVEFDLLTDADPPRRLVIGADGAISVPLAGDVRIAGLDLAAARDELRRVLSDGGFLIEPRIGLSIADYRDVYVIGDVRAPAALPFKPLMTVEQAVGLAGGPAVASSLPPEARVELRAQLEGQMDALAADLAREAIWAARLDAELEGRRSLRDEDLPAAARPFLDADFLEALRPIENEILTVRLDALDLQRSVLEAEISEIEKELSLLDERLGNQDKAMSFSNEEAERVEALIERGYRTASDSSRMQRQVVAEEGVYLAILTQISQARSRLGSRRGDLARLDSDRHEQILQDLQERRVQIDALSSRRKALARQLVLVANFMAPGSGPAPEPIIGLRVRRREGEETVLLAATPLTILRPGDVVHVSVDLDAQGQGL